MSLDTDTKTPREKQQTDFEKFREEREHYRDLYGEITEEKIEEAGELLKKLYATNQSGLARHIFSYFHVETKRQLKCDFRYRHIIKAMCFTGI